MVRRHLALEAALTSTSLRERWRDVVDTREPASLPETEETRMQSWAPSTLWGFTSARVHLHADAQLMCIVQLLEQMLRVHLMNDNISYFVINIIWSSSVPRH